MWPPLCREILGISVNIGAHLYINHLSVDQCSNQWRIFSSLMLHDIFWFITTIFCWYLKYGISLNMWSLLLGSLRIFWLHFMVCRRMLSQGIFLPCLAWWKRYQEDKSLCWMLLLMANWGVVSIGERLKDHIEKYQARLDKSVFWFHCKDEHDRILQRLEISVKCKHPSDVMFRLILEAIYIERDDPDLNKWSEWRNRNVPWHRKESKGIPNRNMNQ